MLHNNVNDLMYIDGGKLRSYIKDRIRTSFQEDKNQITKKLLNDAHIYIQGYRDCLKEYVILPINKKEMELFLHERAFEYIQSRITS